MITPESIKEIGEEARQLLKNTEGNNGRALRRFLGRQCQHNKIIHNLISTTGLWPRQIKAIIEHAEKQAEIVDWSDTMRGPVVLDKESGDITVTYEVPFPIETASVRQMREVVMVIQSMCRMGENYRNERLNHCILNPAKCPDYQYRGYPCNVVSDPWYVGGQDVRGGGGILEWCLSEIDAQERMALMKKHKRFTNLNIGNYAESVKEQEQQRRKAA